MSKKEKLIGKERREAIIEWLSNSGEPLTGSELAERAGVSRQVIVQDISLLKAKNTTIISTSRGYLLLKDINDIEKYERVVVVKHAQSKRKKIDCCYQGVTAKDVMSNPFTVT